MSNILYLLTQGARARVPTQSLRDQDNMNAPTKNRIALRPSVVEARLENRLVLSHVAPSFMQSFVVPTPMITVAPLVNVHTPVEVNYGTGPLVHPKATIAVSPLANVRTPVLINYGFSVPKSFAVMVPARAHTVNTLGLRPPGTPPHLPNLTGPIFF
jgi:hypothetical protein